MFLTAMPPPCQGYRTSITTPSIQPRATITFSWQYAISPYRRRQLHIASRHIFFTYTPPYSYLPAPAARHHAAARYLTLKKIAPPPRRLPIIPDMAISNTALRKRFHGTYIILLYATKKHNARILRFRDRVLYARLMQPGTT